MAEILNKQYEGQAAGRKALTADLQNLWGFEKVEDDGNQARLWINDNTFFRITSGSHNQVVNLVHKGKTVDDGLGNVQNISSQRTTLYAVKTNSATLLCLGSSSSTNIGWNANSVVVLGNVTNHRRGDISSVAAMLKYSSANSTYYPYICADDTSDTTISMSTAYVTSSVKTSAKITVIEPFTADDTATSLNDVYICKKTQMPSLFIGDCAINGRRFYSFGWLFVDDK